MMARNKMTDIKKNSSADTDDSIANSNGWNGYLEPVKNDWSIDELEIAHKCSIRNQASVQNSLQCGCFYCLEIYSPAILTEDDLRAEDDDGSKTYYCHHCGIDSVIGNQAGFPITTEFLTAMNSYYFY
jgi:hypothetical protein